MYFLHNSPKSGGLFIAVKQNLNFKVNHIVIRLTYIILHCTIEGEDYAFINVYNHVLKGQQQKPHTIKWLSDIWNNVQKCPTHRVLMGGDFNLSVDYNPSSVSKLPASDILRQFLEDSDMVDCFRLLNPDSDVLHGMGYVIQVM